MVEIIVDHVDDDSGGLSRIEARLQDDFSERNEEILEMRKLRDMDFDVKIPSGIEAETVIVPTAQQINERMLGMLTTDRPRIKVPPVGPSDDNERQASKMETWTDVALRQLEEQADAEIIERLVECQIVDGVGVARMLYAPFLWRGAPKYKDLPKIDDTEDEVARKARYVEHFDVWKMGRPLPIAWNWIDPLCAYPLWSEAGLEAFMEVDERDIAEFDPTKLNRAKEFPELWELRSHNEGNGKVHFMQYWTRDSLSYCIDHKLVHKINHKYRYPPYVYIAGQSVSDKRPSHRTRSMLYNVKYLIPYLNRLLSQKGTAIRIWCWPTPIVRQSDKFLSQTDPNTGVPQLRTIEIQPGKAVSLYSDEEITFLTWQGNGPDADEMITLIMGMIEKAGISDVMYGQASGEQSGYSINQLIAAARVRFKPLIRHIERGLEMQIKLMWDIIEYQIGSPLPLYVSGEDKGWMYLGPKDLKDYRQVRVEMQPIIPTDAYANSSQAINELQAGLRDTLSAMEKIGIEQPDRMRDRILVDEYMRSEQVKGFLIEAALKRVNFDLEQEAALAASVTPQEFEQIWKNLPPAARQAIAMQELQGGGPMGGMPPGLPSGPTAPTGPSAPSGPLPPVMGQNAAGPPVMGAPGAYAAPVTPVPGRGSIGANAYNPTGGTPKRTVKKLPKQGPKPRPRGVKTGKPTGPRKVGSES